MGNTLDEDGSEPVRRNVLPWKETSPEDEQVRFIEQCQGGRVTLVEACRQFGISRKTGYRRLQRFRTCGWSGLGDRSRAPHSHPNETPRAIGRAADRGQAGPSNVGAEEGGGIASKGRATSALAGAQHGREHTGPSWAGASTETATARGSVGRALCLCAQPQRRLGHRLQRVVPHRRRRSHRPAHRARTPPRGTCWSATGFRSPEGLRYKESLSALSGSMDCPRRSEATTDRPLQALVLGACRSWQYGGSSWASFLSESSPATRNRTDGWSGCTGR